MRIAPPPPARIGRASSCDRTAEANCLAALSDEEASNPEHEVPVRSAKKGAKYESEEDEAKDEEMADDDAKVETNGTGGDENGEEDDEDDDLEEDE